MKRNSVKQIVNFLDLTVCASEGQIQRRVFNYDRNSSNLSNKKYADMLRRGSFKKLYNSIELRIPGIKSRKFYFTGSKEEMNYIVNNKFEELKQIILKQEY